MNQDQFTEGARVTSPYADPKHYAIGGQRAPYRTEQIGTVGPVDTEGWADVTYADGYRLMLNAERANLYAHAPLCDGAGLHTYDHTGAGKRFDTCDTCGRKWHCGSLCTVGSLPTHEPEPAK